MPGVQNLTISNMGEKEGQRERFIFEGSMTGVQNLTISNAGQLFVRNVLAIDGTPRAELNMQQIRGVGRRSGQL